MPHGNVCGEPMVQGRAGNRFTQIRAREPKAEKIVRQYRHNTNSMWPAGGVRCASDNLRRVCQQFPPGGRATCGCVRVPRGRCCSMLSFRSAVLLLVFCAAVRNFELHAHSRPFPCLRPFEERHACRYCVSVKCILLCRCFPTPIRCLLAQ